MKEILSVGLWLVLTGAAFTTAVFVVQSVRSKEPVSIGASTNRQHTLGSLIYLSLVATGWLAIVGVGVYGLLTWLPRSADEFRGTLALGAAFFSLPVLTLLERATFMRQELAVNNASLTWIDYQLHYSSRPTDGEIERLSEESRGPNKTDTELQIARWTLALAKELKERDERTEAQVIQRLRREQEEKEAERERQVRQAAQKAAKEDRANEVRAALNKLVRTSPTVQDVDELHEDEEVVLDVDLMMASWHRFKDFAARALKPHEKCQLALLLQELPGIQLPEGIELQLQYKGTERDGCCDAYAIVNDEQLPLREGVRFTETAEGLLNAFFLSACLPGQWSWGHGFYDRDHELITSMSELDCLLTDTPFATTRQENTFEEKWPPAGVRILRRRNTFEVACLAFRAGRGISDLSISVIGGKASALRERNVYIWGGGVFY